MTAAEQVRKDIAAAKRRGFEPGASYWRDETLMVEITPGNFVNEEAAIRFGVTAKGRLGDARNDR
ncbi:MAG: hypothetical protein Q8L13_11615 [Bradyrhizobium sp.]|uniref:hypothetical protein n=1 Tax=Bradyrhizobium sp. TaxID=376 RepID=UPI00272F95F3|nr:hypothetical protein [Bradyrhizobium sp.]MDP1866972.1 hypothetical protein [Bradyrhizobium sp.]